MKKHFVLDFDFTLFDTGRHWNDWLTRLEGVGISRERALSSGESLFGEGYTLIGHGERLGLSKEVLDNLITDFDEFTQSEGEKLVYKDVFPFLSRNDSLCEVSILTFGAPSYQHYKINASGLLKHVPKVRLADLNNMKAKQLGEMDLENKEIVFVDDNPIELVRVHESGLPVELVRMKRHGARHAKDEHPLEGKAWRTIESFDEL
jgi:FMN phosphatase YigB (HAD superfamily)